MELSRRRFLAFVGVTGGAAAADAVLATAAVGADGSVGDFLGRGATPVRLPHQLPIYLRRDSFLPTTGQVGDFGAPLTEYTVLDLAGGLYQQVRTLPRGSNWPNNEPAEPPKPSVVGIRRVHRR